MALGVVILDVLKLGRLAERRDIPIQIPQPLVQVGVAGADVSDVTLEVLHVDRVETDDGGVQPHIGLCDLVAEIERTLGAGAGQVGFRSVQRLEELQDVLLVRLLGGREAGLVHSVVDVVVRPGVCVFDLGRERRRVQVEVGRFELGRQEVVELRVQHANDLGGFVGHDGLLLLVPERGHGEARRVVLVRGEVEVAEVCEFRVERVGGGVGSGDLFIGGREAPALQKRNVLLNTDK